MSLQKEFDAIDAILIIKGHTVLTDVEKQLLDGNWKQRYMQWSMSQKATTHQFALDNQVKSVFCHVISDVLKHTRGINV